MNVKRSCLPVSGELSVYRWIGKVILQIHVGGLPNTEIEFPCVVLTRSTWDDYSYRTLFYAFYYLDRLGDTNSRKELGSVKIGKIGQKSGRTELPITFDALDTTYFSLGQSDEYYDNIRSLGDTAASNVLKSLQDLSQATDRLGVIQSEPVFKVSLTRFLGSLSRIIGTSQALPASPNFDLSFACSLNNSPIDTECTFSFEQNDIVPGRVNAIVGKNGSGKTQFLANLVGAISGVNDTAQISNSRKNIRKIIAVSYSVFDRFFLPNEIKIPGGRRRKAYISDSLKYCYIGLRQKSAEGSSSFSIAGSATLARRFSAAINILETDGLIDKWKELMAPILADSEIGMDGVAEKSQQSRFKRLGAGHKATLTILTSLFSELIDGSLVVIDEPENHLHPNLLSTTLHILREMLAYKNSNCIISTHSAIVIQEIPAKHVRVIRKIDGHSQISSLRRESFGTSLDTLNAEIFGMSSAMPNYLSELGSLAASGVSLEDIDNALGNALSPEARSYFLSMQYKK